MYKRQDTAEIQNTLAALLANMKIISEENKAGKEEMRANIQKISEEAIKQNKTLHEDNKKYTRPCKTSPNRASSC